MDSPSSRDPSRTQRTTLQTYAADAIARRRVRGEALRPRTVKLYDGLMTRLIAPALGAKGLYEIRRVDVNRWYASLPPDQVTQRAHAYALLRSLFEQATNEGVFAGPNPCAIRGAGITRRRREIRPASIKDLAALVNATPDNLKAAILLAAWCGLRCGEVFEMRRGDVDADSGVIHIRRAVVRIDRREVIGRPKSEAGVRAVAVPPHVQPALDLHLDRHVAKSRSALLFSREPASIGRTETSITRHGSLPEKQLDDEIYGFTICTTQLRCWRPKQVPPWRSSWPGSAIVRPLPPCAIN